MVHDAAAALTVLGWHNVEPTWRFPAAAGRGRRGLAAQLAALGRVAHVVDLTAALADLARGRPLAPRSVALTFDDGYADNLDVAVPVLEAFAMPATFFVNPGFLDGHRTPWWDRLAWALTATDATQLHWRGTTYPLDGPSARKEALATVERWCKVVTRGERETAVDAVVTQLAPHGDVAARGPMLDWHGAAQLVRRGFTIGSHSWAHAVLANETDDAQHADLAAARHVLQDRLDVGAELLAYPNGTPSDFDVATQVAAHRAGHTAALTTIDGVNVARTPRFALRRFVLAADRGLAAFRPVLRFAAMHARRASVPHR